MTREQAEALRTDDKHWRLGVIYNCKEDPRFIVRNRWKIDWNWNFGSWKTLLVLPIFIAIFHTPLIIITPLYESSTNEVTAMTAGVLLVLVIIANYVVSGPR